MKKLKELRVTNRHESCQTIIFFSFGVIRLNENDNYINVTIIRCTFAVFIFYSLYVSATIINGCVVFLACMYVEL